MANVNSVYNNSNRITGMFSDMDTDALVKNLCAAQQTKIDTQYRKKQSSEWKNTALTEIADKVKEFSNTYCSVLGSSSMLKSSTYSKYSVTTTSTSGAVTVDAGGEAFDGKITVSVEQLAGNAAANGKTGISTGTELSAKNTATLSELAFATPLQFDAKGNISFKINGKKFEFSGDTTLQNMISTINADADANVTMKYSRLTDSFTVTSDNGGKDGKVTIENISGNAFGEGGAFGIGEGVFTEGAQNAIAYINGVRVEREENEFTIDDVSYKLNATTEEEMQFSVTRDFSSTVDAVKTFVNAVNDLLSSVKLYTDAKDETRTYKPLTDAEKDEMTEDEIEKWEARAKGGILSGNQDLENLLSSIKDAFFSNAGGTGKNLTSIGISTGGYFDTDAGLLKLDEDALKAALEKDSDAVVNMFTGGNSSVSKEKQGAVYQLRNSLNAYLSTSNNLVEGLDKEVTGIEDEIDTMEDKLAKLAEKYYNKFAAMETALAKLNSTAGYISSMFAG